MSADIRKAVVDMLKPVLPKAWVWVDHTAALDTVTRPTLMLELDTVERGNAIDSSLYSITYKLSVLQPNGKDGVVDDALDDQTLEVLYAIDDLQGLDWSTATRGVVQNFEAFQINITFQSRKDEPTESTDN